MISPEKLNRVQREFNAVRQDCTGRVIRATAEENLLAEMIALPARFRWSALFMAIVILLCSSLALASEITLQQAVEQVQRETNAKVLSVQTLRIGKRKMYRIKILTAGGQVRVLEIKADQ